MPPILPQDSTLKTPSIQDLATFRLDRIGDDRVSSFLEKGFSLAICCRRCKRLVEWTPPDLESRFAAKSEVSIAAIAERLSCTGEDGCGSTDIAVFPHLYDRPWRWSGPAR